MHEGLNSATFLPHRQNNIGRRAWIGGIITFHRRHHQHRQVMQLAYDSTTNKHHYHRRIRLVHQFIMCNGWDISRRRIVVMRIGALKESNLRHYEGPIFYNPLQHVSET